MPKFKRDDQIIILNFYQLSLRSSETGNFSYKKYNWYNNKNYLLNSVDLPVNILLFKKSRSVLSFFR